MSLIADVEELASQLPALISAHKADLASKQKAMKELQTAGLTYAAEHWRDGKYLYLIHPSRDGQRERKYVGADPAKIAVAQASIRRAGEYDQLSREAMQIEVKLRQGGDRLRDAVAYLTGKRTW